MSVAMELFTAGVGCGYDVIKLNQQTTLAEDRSVVCGISLFADFSCCKFKL